MSAHGYRSGDTNGSHALMKLELFCSKHTCHKSPMDSGFYGISEKLGEARAPFFKGQYSGPRSTVLRAACKRVEPCVTVKRIPVGMAQKTCRSVG